MWPPCHLTLRILESSCVRGSWRVNQNWLIDKRRESVSGERLACVRVTVTKGHDVKGAARGSRCWACQVLVGLSLSRTCRTQVHRHHGISLLMPNINPAKAFQGWISWYFLDEEVDFNSDFWVHPEWEWWEANFLNFQGKYFLHFIFAPQILGKAKTPLLFLFIYFFH